MSRGTKRQRLLDLSVLQTAVVAESIKVETAASETPDSPASGVPDDVDCPVCSKSIIFLAMDLRIRHVEECLSVFHLKQEDNISKLLALAAGGKTKAQKSIDTQKPAKAAKIAKTKKVPEHLRYVNTQTKKTVPKAAKAEEYSEMLPSSRTQPIPQLKILSFKKDRESVHEVAVDAFCFKPHESIQQYFLTHFHSDHYGGISKRWCRERTINSKILYCSTITAKLLAIRFKVDPVFMFPMETNKRYMVYSYNEEIDGGLESAGSDPGLYVLLIDANHCPGAVIFLFESILTNGDSSYTLHCGDFRVCRLMMEHPLLSPFLITGAKRLEKVYLDTTYMSPKHSFPKQENVCLEVGEMFAGNALARHFSTSVQTRITDYLFAKKKKKRFLILVGTYLIGKERLAIAISKRLSQCPIYVSNINSRGDKLDIIHAYSDTYLELVLTDSDLGSDEHEHMVHLVPMSIVGSAVETANYFNHNLYFDHFEKCIGLRPTGWSFAGRGPDPENVDCSLDAVVDTLRTPTPYSYKDDILTQTAAKSGANKQVDSNAIRVFSVPYSEHLLFRELSFFGVFVNVEQIIPTVNTEKEQSRDRMQAIIRLWEELRKAKLGHTLHGKVAHVVDELTLQDF